MTVRELIERFRLLAKDEAEPHFWGDDLLLGWLNDALVEAAIRARLLLQFETAVSLSAGTSDYALPNRLYEITAAQLESGGEISALPVCSLDGVPRDAPCLVQTDTTVRILPAPVADGTLWLSGFRLPEKLTSQDDTPEIHEVHHVHLLDWLLRCAFAIPDAEGFDPERSAAAERQFTQYFGLPYQADLKRQTRFDFPHTVKPFWI